MRRLLIELFLYFSKYYIFYNLILTISTQIGLKRIFFSEYLVKLLINNNCSKELKNRKI